MPPRQNPKGQKNHRPSPLTMYLDDHILEIMARPPKRDHPLPPLPSFTLSEADIAARMASEPDAVRAMKRLLDNGSTPAKVLLDEEVQNLLLLEVNLGRSDETSSKLQRSKPLALRSYEYERTIEVLAQMVGFLATRKPGKKQGVRIGLLLDRMYESVKRGPPLSYYPQRCPRPWDHITAGPWHDVMRALTAPPVYNVVFACDGYREWEIVKDTVSMHAAVPGGGLAQVAQGRFERMQLE